MMRTSSLYSSSKSVYEINFSKKKLEQYLKRIENADMPAPTVFLCYFLSLEIPVSVSLCVMISVEHFKNINKKTKGV